MNTNKNLLGTLFLAIGTVACTFGANAANSANAYSSVNIFTGGAMKEQAALTGYTAYYCSAATVKEHKMFGGADTYQTITTFLTANMANYKSGIAELGTYGDVLNKYSFDDDDHSYWFYQDPSPATLKEGSYFAVVAYESTDANAENIVRVFSSTTESIGDITLVFDPDDTTEPYGEAGDWTTVNVPEPTSGMLLLLGSALLALKRKRA